MAKFELLDLSMLEDNVVSGDINEYSITLYGEGGSGKSTFANALKRKLGSSASFFFEPRLKGLGGIKAVEMPNWNVFLAYIKQLKQLAKAGKKVPFNNIIIDSVDSAYDKCVAYMLEENDEWEGSLAGDYGARYVAVGNEFKGAIQALRDLGFIVTFLTHEKDKEEHDVNNAAYNRAVPIVPSQIQDIVNDQIDLIMYLQKVTVDTDDGRKEIRRLWLKNNPYIKLKTPIYGLPDYIDYEEVGEGVDKFLAAFDKGVEITRKMYEDGVDISNPNADNTKPVEFKNTATTTNFDELDDLPNVEDVNDFEETIVTTIEDLQDMAIEIRDTLLETMERTEVASILKKHLGMAKIKSCTDEVKLKDFIDTYK